MELRNPARTVVLMVRPTLRDASGRPVLPAYASDGYFSMMPGETRRLTIETPAKTDAMSVTFDGWNTAEGATTVGPGR